MFLPNQLDLFAQSPSQGAVSPTPDFPFRTASMEADEAVLHAMNEEYVPLKVTRMEPAEAAIQRIANTKQPSVPRLLSWALHPDERVRIALLRSPLITRDRTSTLFAAALIWNRTARSLARTADGRKIIELWNPVFDVLQEKRIEFHRGAQFDELLNRQIKLRYDDCPLLEDQLRAVVDWAEGAVNPEWLGTILRSFYSREFLTHIVSHAPAFDLERIRLLLDLWPTLVGSLMSNRHIYARPDSPEIISYLKDWALHAILNIKELSRNPDIKLSGLFQAPGAQVLIKLQLNGYTLPFAFHKRLCDGLNSIKGPVPDNIVLSPHYHAGRFYSRFLAGLPVDVLRVVIPAIGGRNKYVVGSTALANSTALAKVLDRDDITPEVARLVAKHFGTRRIRALLASHPRWRHDPEIRPRLLASTAPEIVAILLQDASPDEFVRVFRRVVERHPDIVGEILGDRLDELAGALTKEDLIPLLQSTSRMTRLVAIQALSQANETPRRKAIRR